MVWVIRFLVVLIVASGAHLTAHGDAGASVYKLADGIWIDDAAATIVAGSPTLPVTAIGMMDGQPRWRTATAARPVMVTKEYVVAMENNAEPGRLSLLSLAKDDGERVARETARLPRTVHASLASTARGRFRLRPHPGFPQSRLVWEFAAAVTNEQGERPLPQSGVVRVDPATARAGVLDERPPPRSNRAARLSVSFAGSSDPAFFSVDRQHVIVSRRAPERSGYEWALYDRDERLLARIDSTSLYAPFIVRGDLMIALDASPAGWRAKEQSVRTLRAVDWRQGTVRWQRRLSTAAESAR